MTSGVNEDIPYFTQRVEVIKATLRRGQIERGDLGEVSCVSVQVTALPLGLLGRLEFVERF